MSHDSDDDEMTVSAMRPFVDSVFRGTPEFAWTWLAVLRDMYPDMLCMPSACRPRMHAMHVLSKPSGQFVGVDAADGVVEDALSKCDGIRFSAWVLVFQSRPTEVHGNALLYDRFANTIVRYEPRGWDVGYDSASMDAVLTTYARETFGATYQSPKSLQGQTGPQRREVVEVKGHRSLLPKNGPCVIWSLLFIALTLEFPDLLPRDIAAKLDTDCVSPRVLAQALGHFIAAHKPVVPVCKRRR